ncbi:unnamed protein product [Coregonus sp. 'balchen']|nr:unnamed protein product [Coregonus sp. 'balchen']
MSLSVLGNRVPFGAHAQ